MNTGETATPAKNRLALADVAGRRKVEDRASPAAWRQLTEGQDPQRQSQSDESDEQRVGVHTELELLLNQLRQQDLLWSKSQKAGRRKQRERHPKPRDAADVTQTIADIP